jgi:hypothetical protein
MVDQRAHQAAIAAEHEERDQRERDSERKHNLTEHEGARGIQPDPDHEQGGRHGDRAA